MYSVKWKTSISFPEKKPKQTNHKKNSSHVNDYFQDIKISYFHHIASKN